MIRENKSWWANIVRIVSQLNNNYLNYVGDGTCTWPTIRTSGYTRYLGLKIGALTVKVPRLHAIHNLSQ
jgi:hypothetical protein